MTTMLRPGLSVLVVDDSAIVRQRLCDLLAENDCASHVSQAATAAQAWSTFEQLSPEAVLIDIQLPDSSGLEILRRIKRIAPSCLVIVLTHLGEPVFRQESHRSGANHFLDKATQFEQVVPLLHRHASQRGLEARPDHAATKEAGRSAK